MNKILLLTFIALSIGAFAQVPGYVPTTNLVAWYGFNGNTVDGSTSANNLTNFGATLTTDRYNVANSAYNFSGTAQYMSIATPSFSFSETGNFSVSLWMQKPTLTYGIVIMSSSGTNGNFIWNFQTSAAGSAQFGTNKQGSSWAWAQSSYVTGQWDHLVCTFSNGSMTLYKNGGLVATSSYANSGALQTVLPLWIGRSHGGNYHTGKIDDIGIWTRVLSLAEIQSLYTGCTLQVVAQPTNKTTIVGGSVAFGASSSNVAATFQWQENSGSGFANLSNGGQFAGATTDTLSVSNITMANKGSMYRCVISESATCADTSNSATLNVCGTFVTQPATQSVAVGTPVFFAATTNDPSATYKWQIATTGAFGDLFNGPVFTGVSTDTLRLTTTALINNNQKFRCIVTSGVCQDTSDVAILTVTNIGIDENLAASVRVFPNPAKQFLIIEIPAALLETKYVVVDAVGKTVLAGTLETERTTLVTEGLAAGAYVIRLGDAASRSFVILP